MTVRARVTFIASVVVPLAAVFTVAVLRTDSSPHRAGPERLPIVTGGAVANAALYPVIPVEYRAAPRLPALDGAEAAYHVGPETWSTGDPNTSISSGVAVACAPGVPCPPPPPTTRPPGFPTEDAARASALDALRAAGFPVDGAAVTASDAGTAWVVNVDPVVDGHPTEGLTGSVTVGAGGVVYGSARVATPERRDTYPLIGTSAAIERLNNGEGLIGPQPLFALGGLPIVPAPDASSEPQVVTFDSVDLVLAFAPSFTGGDGWLVPAYRFHGDDGSTRTVLAIDESFLAPPPGGGSDAPGSTGPGSTGPGSTGEGSGSPGSVAPAPAPPEPVPPASGPNEPASGGPAASS